METPVLKLIELPESMLRDLFAAFALGGLIAAESDAEGGGAFTTHDGKPRLSSKPDTFADVAYTLADAMMEARKKGK